VTRRASLLLIVLAAACSDDEPHARTATLAEAKVKLTPPADAAPVVPANDTLHVPSFAIDISVPPGVTYEVDDPRERNTWLKRGDFNLHLWRFAPGSSFADGAAARASLMKEDGFAGFQVEEVEGGEYRFEYALESAGKRSFGYSLRRLIGGKPIDCSCHDTSKENADAGVAACLSMRPHASAAGAMRVGAEEETLPPGKVWLSVPGLGVDVAAAPEVAAGKPRAGGEVVLSDGTSELLVRRADPKQSRQAIVDRLAREGGGKLGVIVDKVDGEEFHLEYAMKDRKSRKPVFGLVMRRSIRGRTIDCTSRGPETTSTVMALVACHSMRATPH